MTDTELKELLANLIHSQQEIGRHLDESIQEAEKRSQETDRRFHEYSQQAEKRSQETERRFQEYSQEAEKRSQELDRRFQETNKATDKKLKELAKQIGGLGNKFGSFTEGMAFPALEKLLRRRFGMEVVTTRTRVKRNGALMELDVFAYAPEGEVVIVEVKSHLRAEDLEQIVQILTDFPKFFPQYANYPRYGMLAAVEIAENLRRQVLKAGIYLATINDEQFTLQVPESFRAKSFW